LEHLQISLAAARVNADMTQEEVAKRMGLTRATIIAWESGKKILKIWELDALCNIYGISRDNIFLPYNSTKSKPRTNKTTK
jgi:DNA-binding XRE family transcriptional regulator